MTQPKLISPCIGFCTTPLGDDRCRTCLRSFKEVNHWQQESIESQIDIWKSLDQACEQVFTSLKKVQSIFFGIHFNLQDLKILCQSQGIFFPNSSSEYLLLWLFIRQQHYQKKHPTESLMKRLSHEKIVTFFLSSALSELQADIYQQHHSNEQKLK